MEGFLIFGNFLENIFIRNKVVTKWVLNIVWQNVFGWNISFKKKVHWKKGKLCLFVFFNCGWQFLLAKDAVIKRNEKVRKLKP